MIVGRISAYFPGRNWLSVLTVVVAVAAYGVGSTLAGDPWADEVVSASAALDGSGVHNDPLATVGPPATTFFDPLAGQQFTPSLIVAPFHLSAPDGETLITTINAGQFIKVKFDEPVRDDPFNPHGIDLLVFGNAFYGSQGFVTPTTDMDGHFLSSPTFVAAEPVTVAVSASGIGDPASHPLEWYVYASGPFADGAFPSNPFAWDSDPADWGALQDLTKPVDPTLTTADFTGLTAADAMAKYGRSGGGTGFDLAASGLEAIQYVYLTSAGGEVDALADVSPDRSWQQFHGTMTHAGAWHGKLRTMATVPAWSAGIGLVRSSQPAVSEDGAAVFAIGGGMVQAFDAATGASLWSTEAHDSADFGSISSPVYANGFVYYAGGLAGEATAYRMNAENGSTASADRGWVRSLDVGEAVVNASMTVHRDTAFVRTNGGFEPSASRLYAINIADGSDRWVAPDGSIGGGAVAIDARRGLIYDVVFVEGAHTVRAYDVADGSVAWTSPVTMANDPFTLGVSLAGDTLYVQDFSFAGDGILYALDAGDEGALRWEAATPGSGDASVAVGLEGRVFGCGEFSGTGRTRGYDADGTVLWTFEGGGGWQSSPAWADGVTLTGDQSANHLYLLDARTGAIRRRLVGSGPASFGEDRLFSIGVDGLLYAYALRPLNDFDGDGDVDLTDFGVFEACAASFGSSEDCAVGDFDADGDVDFADFGAMQVVFTGAAE
jgi:hypothetical protein